MTRADLASIARGIAPVLRGLASTLHKRIAALEAIPRGLDGADGATGPPGPEGPAGRDGRDGLPGRTGDKGVDGINGQDGLGFDDIQVEYDGERKFSLKFVRGDEVKTFGAFLLPIVIYRGVFTEGTAYERGDAVTWSGSLWIAKSATKAKPMSDARDWQQAVKKGSEGKTGPVGPQGARGPQGPEGPPGPAKW